MTYGINVPITIHISRSDGGCCRAGRYVPEWFPDAKFQNYDWKHAAMIRNDMFAATEKLMVLWLVRVFYCLSLFG
jgi:hypothetical protein